MKKYNVRSAYNEAVEENGKFSHVSILSVQKKLGCDLNSFLNYLASQAKKGTVILSQGEEILTSPEVKAAAVIIRNEPHWLMKIK